MRQGSRNAFALWAVAGAVVTFALLTITSFGLFLLPASVVVIFLIVHRVRPPILPDSLGAIEGVALNLLWGAFISRGVPRCEPGLPLTAVMSGRPGEAVGLVVYLLARYAVRQRERRTSF